MAEQHHPLYDIDINIKSVKCFSTEGSGKFNFEPITFVIGKNNSGKSTVLDVLERISREGTTKIFADFLRFNETPRIELSSFLDEKKLEREFPRNVSGGDIRGKSHWDYGKKFSAKKFSWEVSQDLEARFMVDSVPDWDGGPTIVDRLSRAFTNPFSGKWSLRVRAERDVVPEARSTERALASTGAGLTNLVRAFIHSDDLPRHLVEVDLLNDLNAIYRGDSEFTNILCQENEKSGLWEIYLTEEGKGDIRLSQSGSSLKTAFIITAFLRLVPIVSKNHNMANLIFCLEEPENNFHPALLRRLIEFLADQRKEKGYSLMVTTHSPICIDWAAKREDATILHVRKEQGRTVCQNVLDYGGRTSILEDLDVRGSDILQANGVIWVEGPSDRVYIRKWIDLASKGLLREDTHYTFLYYGGKVLSHFEALPPDEMGDRIKMLLINRNVAVVMDSDRRPNPGKNRKPRSQLNATKRRLIEEVENRGGFSWVTCGKEIENYVPKAGWNLLSGSDLKIDDEYTDIPAMADLIAITKTKVDLAHAIEPYITLEQIEAHLDLGEKMDDFCAHIRIWNGL